MSDNKELNENPLNQLSCAPAELVVCDTTYEEQLMQRLRRAEALANAIMIQTFSDGNLSELQRKHISEGENELFCMLYDQIHEAHMIAADMFNHPEPELQSTR